MAPTPSGPTIVSRNENYDKQMDVLVPVLAAGIPLFIGCALLLIAAISYRTNRQRKCFDFIICKNRKQTEQSTDGSVRRQKNNVIQQSSPKLKKNINHIRYPIDISTITRTLPTIPEVMESYSKMENINFPFIPSLSSTQLKKSFAHSTFRTPSDVPRTAELIESDSGPGKTVTDYNSRSGKYSYQSGFHLISGITPIKDSTICSTEVISYGVSSGFINFNTDSNIQSSAGVNICILSPDVSKTSMIIIPTGSKLIRNLSSSFSDAAQYSNSPVPIGQALVPERRINNTPEQLNATNVTADDSNIKIETLQYREYFIPGISFPTIPTIYPLLRSSEHWV